ncbi:MAG TPA: iron-containing redox enzyme family protein [Bdellovibrionota bacterium]|nr:iron-containing redox enzyme family protein [Bdellovibrionota bacterium]
MNVHQELRKRVLKHPAIHNAYLARFKRGDLNREDMNDFAIQFYGFVKHFPRILATLLASTPDEKAADELCVILASELGNGDPTIRHEYMYHRFLRSIGIEPREALQKGLEPETESFVSGMVELYGHKDYGVALGASFGLENMAITMWDHLIPGLQKLKKQDDFKGMDIHYFTFHRALEGEHEDGMEEALSKSTELDVDDVKYGIETMLNDLQRMWMGLEKRWHTRRKDDEYRGLASKTLKIRNIV